MSDQMDGLKFFYPLQITKSYFLSGLRSRHCKEGLMSAEMKQVIALL